MKQRSPWFFIPTLYFQQGLPVIIVQQLSVVIYKKLGVSNAQIGLWTSLITWPWILKMFWGPWVEMRLTKRKWVGRSQLTVAILLFLVSFFIQSPFFLASTLALFFAMAFASATHDIALDGYYMLALKSEDQAFFVGIRSTFFRLAMIFSNGVLVVLFGFFEKSGKTIQSSWAIVLQVAALIYAVLMLYAYRVMPHAEKDMDRSVNPENFKWSSLKEAGLSFFRQPKIISVLLFLLLYRFGEAMLTKMAAPFLLDPREKGGMGLTTIDVGLIWGNVGVISLVLGGVLGGILISKHGLKKCIWPMVITMTLPNFFYIWAAWFLPPISFVYAITIAEQFGYGFGMAAYMVFALKVCQNSKYSTSHYAIATGFMALGAMIAGIASGYLQAGLGYIGFFIAASLMTLPGMAMVWFIPLDGEQK